MPVTRLTRWAKQNVNAPRPTQAHMDVVAESVAAVYEARDQIKGLKFTYEPPELRFFQARFEEI